MSDFQQDNNIDEQVNEIFSDFSQKKEQEAQHKAEVKKKQEIYLKTRGAITFVGGFLSVILLFYLGVKIFGANSPFRHPKPWAVGLRKDSDYKLDGCIFRQWRIRKAVDMYYAQHNEFPDSMEQLYDAKFLKQKVLCPASKKEYVFKKIEKEHVFCCPAPAVHELDIKEVYCNIASSPPVIKRTQGTQEII